MYDDGYLPVEECAQRMGVSPERVVALVRQGVLRSRDGWVQPAIVTGATE